MITRYGPAAGAILDTARTHDHDLIVMATRGRACMNSALYRSWWSE